MTHHQELISSLNTAEDAAFIARINERIFRPADIPLTSRMINHWHEKGLFPYQQESGKWREFSLVDYIWVLFVNRLRTLNLGLDIIAKIKEQCFRNIHFLLEQYVQDHMINGEPGEIPAEVQKAAMMMVDKETKAQLESPQMRLFSLWLMIAIKKNQDVLVRIQLDEANTTDFVILLHEATDTEQIVKTIAKQGGLFISLQSLLNEFYGSERFTWENIKQLEIDKEARTIISLVREKGIRKITIELHEGKAKTAKSEFALQTLTPEELNNAIVSKKFTEWKVLKQAENELFVQVTKSYKFDN